MRRVFKFTNTADIISVLHKKLLSTVILACKRYKPSHENFSSVTSTETVIKRRLAHANGRKNPERGINPLRSESTYTAYTIPHLLITLSSRVLLDRSKFDADIGESPSVGDLLQEGGKARLFVRLVNEIIICTSPVAKNDVNQCMRRRYRGEN